MGIDLKNGGRSWFLVCCFLLFVALAECEAYDPAHELNCTYLVTIYTSCLEDAATSHPVYIRFGDKEGNKALVHPLNAKFSRRIKPLSDVLNGNASTKPFQNCTVDEYRANRVCMESQICYVFLKLMDEKDNWRVSWVQVQISEEKYNQLGSQRYPIRRYLPPKKWHGFNDCGIGFGTGAPSPPPPDDKNYKSRLPKKIFNKRVTR